MGRVPVGGRDGDGGADRDLDDHTAPGAVFYLHDVGPLPVRAGGVEAGPADCRAERFQRFQV